MGIMKKLIKSMSLILLGTMIFLSNNMLVIEAQENNKNQFTTEAIYDLEGGGKKTFAVYEENGRVGYITIEKTESENRMSNGDYQISYSSTGAWKAGFKVTISNNKIEKVYSPSYVVITGRISGTSLKKVSTTKATYSFLYTISNLAISTGVKAVVSNGQLVVSKL